MLYSQFFVEKDRYVVPANKIVEIVPYISLKSSPLLPDYASGLMNYHGEAVPVIDLCQLFVGRACRKRLSTRIIVVDKKNTANSSILLGFMAEKVTEMISLDDDQFSYSSMRDPDALVDGPVAEYQGSLITKITVEDVFNRLDERFFQVGDNSMSGMAL